MKLIPIIVPLVLSGISNAIADAAPATRPSKEVYLRIADEVEANLQDQILDRFFPATADEQGGGFFENYRVDWKRGKGGNKSIVYQSRLTWTSSQAAVRFPDKAGLYLAMSRRGAACLADIMWDKDHGGFYWTVGTDGKPTGATKQMYGHAFGIYALAASYRATRDQAALDLAEKAFRWMDQHAHDDRNKGYFESIGPDGKPASTRDNAVGAGADQKSMNTSIHILEALTGLYEVWPDPSVKTRVEEMLDICRGKVYGEPGYLTQFFTPDWQRTTSPDSFGHDVEAGYLMVEAAQVLGRGEDARVWHAARQLTDHAIRYGVDAEHGGLYEFGTIDDKGAITGGIRTEKVWWIEAEYLNALLLQHQRFGKETPRYWEAFVKQWDWITRHQVDPVNGGWWPYVHADGTPASRSKADMWTECYHQARAMLVVSERLRKLAATEN